jgi:hypothetical protein
LNIFKSTKKSNTLFLVIVLVAGTIALSSPSFINEVNAQGEAYYRMDDNSYGEKSYESEKRTVTTTTTNNKCTNIK